MNSWPFPQHHGATPESHLLSKPGVGTRLTVNSLGYSTGAGPRGQTFQHPWRPALSSGRVTFNLGTVASFAGAGPIEPKITVNGQLVPMSGKDGITPAGLTIQASAANSDGVSYAALEVHPDDTTGELLKDSKVEIIHTNTPVSHARTFGRTAIALILWSGGQPLRVLPIVHFNLRYTRVLPAVGGGAPRHLFL